MKTVIVYDRANGRPLRILSCASLADVLVDMQDGEAYLESGDSPQNKIVRDGKLVDLPEKPSPLAIFDYDKGEWDMQLTYNAEMQALRSRRQSLLQESDWTQVADAPVDRFAWAGYRQALRDLPANTTDPRSPVWPTEPV